jgi:hypothetical protein
MESIIVICATGRSGSTTLKNVLNTAPNTNICGENSGAVMKLLDFYMTLKDIPLKHFLNADCEFYNTYDIATMTDYIRRTIVAMFKNAPETTTWGFKEITWTVPHIEAFKELFPSTKIIFSLCADVEKQCANAQLDTNPAKDVVRLRTAEFLQYNKDHKGDTLVFFKEDIRDLAVHRRLFTFCNLQMDVPRVLRLLDVSEKMYKKKPYIADTVLI